MGAVISASSMSNSRRLKGALGLLQIATQARQVLTLCEQKGTDKVQLEYDPRNPFDICSLTFTPIYRQDSTFISALLIQSRHAWYRLSLNIVVPWC